MLDFNQYRVLTFDCYGTLIDWERGILNALRPVLDRHSITMTDDEALELFGELESAAESGPYLSYHEVLTVVLAQFAERLGFTLADDERLALADSVGNWPPFPDTVEGLQTLARHFQLVILSNVDDALFAGSAKHLQDRVRRRHHRPAGRQLQAEPAQLRGRAGASRRPEGAGAARRPEPLPRHRASQRDRPDDRLGQPPPRPARLRRDTDSPAPGPTWRCRTSGRSPGWSPSSADNGA